MSVFLTALAAGGGLFLLYLLIWRLLANYFPLPCPPGFIFLLESPLINRVAGAQALIQRAGVKPGMHVLDAGCGPGRVTVPLAELLDQNGKVTAFDMQEGMLNRLKSRLEERGLDNVKVIQGQFGEDRLPRESFDRAFLVSVLGEVPDRSGALEELYRALVPGGILSITEVLPDPHYLRQYKVEQLAREAGFETELAQRGWRSYTINLIKPTTRA